MANAVRTEAIENLIALHSDNLWGECPEFPKANWLYAVCNGDTVLGYWEWVYSEAAQAPIENYKLLRACQTDGPSRTQRIEVEVAVFDKTCAPTGTTTMALTQAEINDIVSHAAQLAVKHRSQWRSSGDTETIEAELEEALDVAGVLERVEGH